MSGPLQPGVTCARCHSTLSGSTVGGNCPACLVGIALGEPVPEDVLSEREGGLPGWMGNYEILSEVGRGGSSVVYRARQRGVNRVVALKVLQGAILHRRDALERLRVEAEAIGRLEHPHIVPLYEVGRSEGLPFLVLRLHAGQGPLFAAVQGLLTDGTASGPLAEIGAAHGLGLSAVKMRIHRWRARYRELLLEEVANTVPSPADLHEELRHLMQALAG